MSVGDQTGVGAEIPDDELDRVVGRLLQRRDARVRRLERISLEPVVGLAALAERRVLPLSGVDVDLLDRGLQGRRVDACVPRELAERPSLQEVAGCAGGGRSGAGTAPRCQGRICARFDDRR